jgi:hypothetical protein
MACSHRKAKSSLTPYLALTRLHVIVRQTFRYFLPGDNANCLNCVLRVELNSTMIVYYILSQTSRKYFSVTASPRLMCKSYT